MKELYNRSQIHKKNKTVFQKWLNKVSFLIIFTSGLSALQTLLMTIPNICQYVSVKYFQIDIICHFLLTYYQIIRLHYCFRKEYPKILFIIFYSNGIFLFIYLTTFSNLTIKIHINNDNLCEEIPNSYAPIFYPVIPYAWYFIWDSLVLILYIINIRRLKHQLSSSINNNQNPNNDNDHNQQRKHNEKRFVNRVLRKVLILTVLIQMLALIIIILVTIAPTSQWPVFIGYTIKPPLVSLLMYYLLQHNHKHYKWMIKNCISCHCCCCCQEFVYQTIPNISHTSSQGQSSSNDNDINNDVMQLSEIINTTYNRSEDERNQYENDELDI